MRGVIRNIIILLGLSEFKDRLHYAKVLFNNRVKRVLYKKADNRFLFILSPLFCGSTLLNELLSTSINVSSNNNINNREGQRLPGVSKLMFIQGRRWEDDLDFDWKQIREKWMSYWDITRPILLEKSPPNILRAESISLVFEPLQFIILYRNPYALCESLIRRNKYDPIYTAEFALKCLRYQKQNIEKYKEALVFSYEQLTNNPSDIISKIVAIIPELSDIDSNKVFRAHNFKKKKLKITNLNDEKIANLSASEIASITRVFEKEKELLFFFGYELIYNTDY